MRKGALLTSILAFLSSFMIIANGAIVMAGRPMAEFVLGATSPPSFEFFAIIFSVVFFVLMQITIMMCKKVLYIIGNVIMIIGAGVQTGGFTGDGLFIGMGYQLAVIGGVVTSLGSVIALLGAIQFRNHSKIGVITAVLNSVLSFVVFLNFFGDYFVNSYQVDPNNTNLGFTIVIYGSLFTLYAIHGLLFSFSKKSEYGDEDIDIMSVQTGGAFASYVPADATSTYMTEENKKNKKKKKGKSSSDAYTFDF